MENILKVFLMAFPEWLACIFMVVGLVVTALAAVRLGYGLVVAKTVYKWIVNAEEKFGSGAGAEKKAHVIAVLRGYTPDWLDWAINERTLDWIVQLVFDFTKKKLEDYMAKKSAETTTVAHFGNVGENKRNGTSPDSGRKPCTEQHPPAGRAGEADRCSKRHEHQYQVDHPATRNHKPEP